MLALALLAASLEPADPFLRMPDAFGDKVAFVCEGDIWIGSLSSGQATRLTRHPGKEEYPRFSPDGKTIAFAGGYDGPTEIYTIPVSGGAPQRITYLSLAAHPMAWSADGKKILYRSVSI